MNNEKKKNYKNRIVWIIIILLSPVIFRTISGILKPDIDDICARIEEHLYEKYGEEFVVDRIGIRTANGKEFYQARIYPKSIIGTNKQGDNYYYASASVNKYSFGRLGGVGDSYSYVYRNINVENYLLPEAKKTFGERILLKVDVAHKVTGDGSWWAGYKSSSLEEMRRDMEEEPDRTRIELDLYIYIFDRIETEEEKEERRKQIFDFIQYLKEEGLFEYLEMGVIFIDERVLAPGYIDYYYKINRSEKVKEEIEGETIYLPPLELRKEMSEVLQKEVDGMSEEEMLESMRGIRKDELTNKEIGNWNAQYLSRIYSQGMIKERYTSAYNKNPDIVRSFTEIDDVGLAQILNYIYKEGGNK